MFKDDHLILKRFNGIEEYPITRAVYNCDTDINWSITESFQHALSFQIHCTSASKTLTDTAEYGAEPCLEINYYGDTDLSLPLKAGDKFFIATDFIEGVGNTNYLYYFSYEGMSDIHIKVEDMENDLACISMTAKAIDPDYYDNSKAMTQVYIKTQFKLDPEHSVCFS